MKDFGNNGFNLNNEQLVLLKVVNMFFSVSINKTRHLIWELIFICYEVLILHDAMIFLFLMPRFIFSAFISIRDENIFSTRRIIFTFNPTRWKLFSTRWFILNAFFSARWILIFYAQIMIFQRYQRVELRCDEFPKFQHVELGAMKNA